jgi:CMP-N-acetylneuraminic acid synthetase
MKNIEEICVVIQARLSSQRLPQKMIKPFAGKTLVDILLEKTNKLIIPKSNIYFSAYEKELKEIAKKYEVNIFDRSEKSARSEGQPLSEIYEWWDKIPFKYVVLISACNPLLKVETINNFIENFIQSDSEGLFAVFEKKTYYWNKNSDPITDWRGHTIMNTKIVEPIYEAAHCLYASRMDMIGNDKWMDTNYPPKPKLFIMDEIESFDIDYEWQFNVAQSLYEELC